MADLDDIKDGKDFRTDQPQQNIPFILKGCGALDWGMQSRLSRIFNPKTGKTVMLAFDHGYNASLQWLPDHYELFPHLVSLLSPLGVLAVQMPDNWLEPTHVLMREVAWEQNYPDRGREPLAGVHAYYDILSEAGCEVDIWRTTYYHQMPSHQAIIDWVTATGLRPWLQDLTESEQQHFLTRYHQMLEEQYPLQENGQILLAFPRLFIVARRTE